MRTRDVMIIAVAAILIVMLCTFAVHDGSGKDAKGDAIGIIGAMDVEVDGLKKTMDVERVETIAGMEYYIGKIYGQDVVISKCGMGKVNAGICAQMMISEFNVNCIINTGVAGSLSEELDIGDIVISTSALQHDFDASPIGFEKGEIPYTGLVRFEADKELISKLHSAIEAVTTDVTVLEGTVCSGDQFIASIEDRERILTDFEDGLCCEMEGGAIAQICYLNDVPFVILRCMSDKADGTSPEDYPEFERMAAFRNILVLQQMLLYF